MDDTTWEQLQYWFEEALKQDAGDRAAFLEVNCKNVPGLAEEVLALLKADEQQGSLLSGLLLPRGGLEELLSPMDGAVIGPYQIDRLLGRGGMGAVYLAHRVDGQFEQQVAVKLLKRGMDSDELLHRFRIERQIQARLEHPHIARLLDGGLSADGQPYFTMEYVPGVPLNQYIDQRPWNINEHLHLFQQISSAIQYAHGQLVIHRDLKPSNIMVGPDGQVKLLDFGIARLLDDDSSAITRADHRVYTPEYASPEQVQGKPVGTATDIYSLGVVLYELLSGNRPLDLTELSPAAREQRICEERPKPPSQHIQASLPEGAMTPERLRKRLRGDLDTICLKALRKEPQRRYATAGDFSADIDRHLQDLPVSARPDTFAYRSRKFIQRNRLAIIAGLAMLLLLAGVTSMYTWRLSQERDRARLEAEKAKQVTEFITHIFEENNPIVNQGDSLTARQLLDRGTDRIKTELAQQPELKQEMLALMGDLYSEMGLANEARTLYGDALDIEAKLANSRSLTTARILRKIARVELVNGFPERADSLIRAALAIRIEKEAPEDAEQGELVEMLGEAFIKTRGLDSAEYYLLQSLEIFEKIHESPHSDIAATLQSIGVMYDAAFEKDKAIDYLQQAIAMHEQLEKEQGIPFRRPMLLHAMGMAHMRQGDTEFANQYFDEALTLFRSVYGNAHPTLGNILRSKALLLADEAKYEEAKVCLDECLRLYQNLYGEKHPRVATVLSELGTLRSDQLDYAGAEAYYRQSLALRDRNKSSQSLAIVLVNLGAALEKQKRYKAAEPYYVEGLEIDKSIHGNVHPYIVDDLTNLGDLKREQNQIPAAIAYYRQAIALVDSGLSPQNRYVATAFLLLGRELDQQAPQAAAFEMIQQALSIRQEVLPPTSPHISTAQRILAEALIRRSQYNPADSLLNLSIKNLETNLGTDHPLTEASHKVKKDIPE